MKNKLDLIITKLHHNAVLLASNGATVNVVYYGTEVKDVPKHLQELVTELVELYRML